MERNLLIIFCCVILVFSGACFGAETQDNEKAFLASAFLSDSAAEIFVTTERLAVNIQEPVFTDSSSLLSVYSNT